MRRLMNWIRSERRLRELWITVGVEENTYVWEFETLLAQRMFANEQDCLKARWSLFSMTRKDQTNPFLNCLTWSLRIIIPSPTGNKIAGGIIRKSGSHALHDCLRDDAWPAFSLWFGGVTAQDQNDIECIAIGMQARIWNLFYHR